MDTKYILVYDPFVFTFFVVHIFSLCLVCLYFILGFVCVGAVGESIMQFVQFFSPSFTTELFLRQKRPIIFVFVFFFLLSTHSIFVMLPIHVKLWCTIHTCLGSEKLLFSVKYVTGNTVFINKDLFLDQIWHHVIDVAVKWGRTAVSCR